MDFGELKTKIIRLLGDDPVTPEYGMPIAGNQYDAAILRDGVHAALQAITIRLWKPAILSIDSGSATVEVPDDVIDVEAVYDAHLKRNIPKKMLAVGDNPADTWGNAWIPFPYGSVTFLNVLTEGGTLYYSANWTQPETDDETIEVPGVGHTALSLYAASYCLLRSASTASNVRQYATKVDSGTPVDNPLIDQSNALMRRYEIELSKIPAMQKGITQ